MNTERTHPDGAGPDRDAPLRLALTHAPDRDLHAPAAVRQALQQAARNAAAAARAASSGLEASLTSAPAAAAPVSRGSLPRQVWAIARSWCARGLHPAALGGLASVAVAGLALHLWMAQQGWSPEEHVVSSAPATAAPQNRPAPATAGAAADTEGAPSAQPPPGASGTARVEETRRPGPSARRIEATPPVLATAPSPPAAAPAPAPAVARPPTLAMAPAPVSDQAGTASSPPSQALAKAAPVPPLDITAPRVAQAAAPAPAADRGRSEPGPSTEVLAGHPSSSAAPAAVAMGRALDGLAAAGPTLRVQALPPLLERLADALRDPAATAAGWTVAEPGGAGRPMDAATRTWWRQLICESAGRWQVLAPDDASVALAGAAGRVGFAVTAPDGRRFTLHQLSGHWLLIPAPGTDVGEAAGAVAWRAPRPGDRAAASAPPP